MAKNRKKARPAHGSQGLKPRELALPDGGKLVLHADGSIVQLDGRAETVKTCVPGDPEWPGFAIRFGFIPQPLTVKPSDARSRH